MLGNATFETLIICVNLLLLAALLAAATLWYMRAKRPPAEPPARVSQADLANMMILFQTMRDLLQEQKDLARQLNRSLDGKVAYIKRSVDAAKKDLEDLRDSVRRVSLLVSQTKSGLAALPKSSRPAPVPPAPPIESHTTFDTPESVAPTPTAAEPPMRILPHPERTTEKEPAVDDWSSLDFGGDEPEPPLIDIIEGHEEPAPESPEDAMETRKAVSSLLGMHTPATAPASPGPSPAHRNTEGNGRRPAVSPLHARIYEYSDAGMNIAQIAGELGIGKGEVRLILSLRQSREV